MDDRCARHAAGPLCPRRVNRLDVTMDAPTKGRVMRRATILVAIFALVTGLMSAAAEAQPDPFKGRWVAVDADESIWHITIAEGQFHGIDSATIPGEGARTRTWGDLTALDEFTKKGTLNLQFLAPGPPSYLFLEPWILTYDPVTDTIIGDQTPIAPAVPLIQFCRVPCDPSDYPPFFP